MRSMDLSHPNTRLIILLTLLTGVVGVVVWWSGGSTAALWAPVQTFVIWAFVREIDPDHPSTAVVAAIAAGVWVLLGLDFAGALAVAALMLAARFVVNTTGRRPLTTDLVVNGVLASVVAFTTIGWVAGFGLAVAIYIDDRMSHEPTTVATLTSALAALGASAVATFALVFPKEVPDVRPPMVIAIGFLALWAVVREPAMPTSLVDARYQAPLSQNRLHAGRSLMAILIFIATLLAGADVIQMGPLAIGLTLALVSNEIENARRR
jgi:hypothetical protein